MEDYVVQHETRGLEGYHGQATPGNRRLRSPLGSSGLALRRLWHVFELRATKSQARVLDFAFCFFSFVLVSFFDADKRHVS